MGLGKNFRKNLHSLPPILSERSSLWPTLHIPGSPHHPQSQLSRQSPPMGGTRAQTTQDHIDITVMKLPQAFHVNHKLKCLS